MDIAITGATGLIGTALSAHLTASGHTVVPVTRSGNEGVGWDPAEGRIDAAGFEGLDAVVHLAGEGIGNRRWNDQTKARILDSRVDGTGLLAQTLAGLDNPPSVLLSGSAIGFYGDRGDEILDEDAGKGDGFLADVVEQWEAAAAPAIDAGIRTCFLRTGIVLTPKGGALAKLLPLFKLGAGGKMGSGKQYWSWIGMRDQVGMIEWLLTADVSGPVNLTGPDPVTNTEFTKTLGRVLGRPTMLPVPAFGPKLVIGSELAKELLFTSTRAVPSVATSGGYQFADDTLEAALSVLLSK
ncbi:MAG: TIGR01777 family oxidoreductase [Acidimicrobiales bacterium]